MNRPPVIIVFMLTISLACSGTSGQALTEQQIEATVQARIQATQAAAGQQTEAQPAAPTNTPEPLPEPIELTGAGDSIIDLDKGQWPAIATISGNQEARHFAVTSYASNGDIADVLVNTTDPYAGIVPIDFDGRQHTTRFEINAEGPWQITIQHASEADRITVPGQYTGQGDNVLILDGEQQPDTAFITGNQTGRHFAVFTYGSSSYDVVVNTTDPYDGQVILKRDTVVFVITAEGSWTIDVKGTN